MVKGQHFPLLHDRSLFLDSYKINKLANVGLSVSLNC